MKTGLGKPRIPIPQVALHPLETAWLWFCGAVVRIFYRMREVEGMEQLPSGGPVLLCANHPSSLVDAVIIQSAARRIIHPLARGGLFRNPLLRPMLALIQAVPVYRRQDGEGGTRRNDDAFERCYQLLGEDQVILIFPEGVTHADPKLREIRTGAARLALGALERNGKAPLLLPVGLNFSEIGRFRSSVFVKVGRPVPVAPLTGEASEADVVALTESIRQAIAEATLNLETWEEHHSLRRLERFFALRRGKYRKRSLGVRFKALQKLIQARHRLRRQAPQLLERTMRNLGRFERLCDRFGVRDYHLTIRYTPFLVARFILRSLVVLLGVLPLALWGLLNSLVPFLLTGRLAVAVSSDRYQYDTAKVLLGMLFFGGFWGAQTGWVYFQFGPWPAVGYALTLLPGAALALFIKRERERIIDNIRAFFAFIRKRKLREVLETRRRELERELAQLTRIAAREGPSQ